MLTITAIEEVGRPARPRRRASPRRPAHAPGDPAAPWWTARDLAVVFGRADAGAQAVFWIAEHHFPRPLPWSRAERRWRPDAVLAWKAEQERACGA